MTVDDELLRNIRANAAFAISKLGPLSDVEEFGLNKQSVAWIEEFIERQRRRSEAYDGENRLVDVIGSFLGEAIIADAGGEWTMTPEGGLGVVFDSGAAAYPFNKVAKQFRDGVDAGESILSFYDFSIKKAAAGEFGE